MTKYILVTWPDSQKIYDNPREEECYFTEADTVFVPEDLYNEIFKED